MMTLQLPLRIPRIRQRCRIIQQQQIHPFLLWIPIAILLIQTHVLVTSTVTTQSIPCLFQCQLSPPRYRTTPWTTSTGTCRSTRGDSRDTLQQQLRHERSQHHASNRNNANNNMNINNNNNNNTIDLSILEEHVLASVQSQIDTTRVLQALAVDEPSFVKYNPNRSHPHNHRNHNVQPSQNNNNYYNTYNNNKNQNHPQIQPLQNPISDLLYDYEDPPPQQYPLRPISSTYQISVAAAVVCGTVTFIVLHNLLLAVLVSISVFVTAFLDDTTTTTTTSVSSNDNITGALARILGRTTIRSVQASEPKIKAIARVVITGQEEIQYLQQTIQLLQKENDILQQENCQLQQWKQTQLLIHQSIYPQYTLVQLKDMARIHQLPVSGTKLELIERLLEANIIQLS